MTPARSAAIAVVAALSWNAVSAQGTAPERTTEQVPTVRVVGERPHQHDPLAQIADYRVPASATRITPPEPVAAWQLVSMR